MQKSPLSIINRFFIKHIRKKKYSQNVKREASAVKIQRAFRSFLLRREFRSYYINKCAHKIQSFYIPKNVDAITGDCFDACKQFTEFKIDNDHPKMAVVDGVLFNKAITSLLSCPPGKTGSYTMPNTVTIIEGAAFITSQLEHITFSTNLTEIKAWAFSEALIRDLNLPPSIRIIGGDAFRKCSSLTTVIFPEGLESIGNKAFELCYGLTLVQFPSTLKTLEGGVFYDCPHNINITFDPDSNLDYEPNLNWIVYTNRTFISQCLGSENNYTIANTYETIGTSAFQGKKTLSKIFFEENSNLKYIQSYAFSECSSLYEIEFPPSLISIEKYAFSYCSNLTNINFSANIDLQNIYKYAFLNCTSLKILNLPSNSVSREQKSLVIDEGSLRIVMNFHLFLLVILFLQ